VSFFQSGDAPFRKATLLTGFLLGLCTLEAKICFSKHKAEQEVQFLIAL
jgi:hypothetical protein